MCPCLRLLRGSLSIATGLDSRLLILYKYTVQVPGAIATAGYAYHLHPGGERHGQKDGPQTFLQRINSVIIQVTEIWRT
jgi:hypothetical protein